MTIDKSWISCRRRNSDEFWNGLQAFMLMAKEHVSSCGKVRCPCKKCSNNLYKTLDRVEADIHRWGFDEHYQKWIYHGEDDTPPVVDDVAPTTDEMIHVLNDINGENNTNEEDAYEGSQKKKGRGRATNQKLIKTFERNGKRKLPIEFDLNDQETYSPVGDNHSLFTRCIGNYIGSQVPLYYDSWDHVPERYKVGVWPQIEYYFDLASHRAAKNANAIMGGIDRLCADRYRDRKTKTKAYFKSVGGFADVDSARSNPPEYITKVEWGKTIDFYLDPKNMTRAEINAHNRAKGQITSLHGSSTYVQARYKKRDPVTQRFPSLIDTYRDMHNKSGEWTHEHARLAHEEMLRIKESQTQQQGSGSSSSVNDAQILSNVLGERRGHIRGRGRKLKGVASSPMPQPKDDRVVSRKKIDSLISQTNNAIERILQVFKDVAPDVPPPNIPPIVLDSDDDEDLDDC